jgi:hypothetical protein
MPCIAHTIFYRGCGHVFLAQSPSSPSSSNPPHASPKDFPCNKHLPYTINFESSKCQNCLALPIGFEVQPPAADPTDIGAFDDFAEQWIKEASMNRKAERILESASRASYKVRKAGTVEEKHKGEVKEGLEIPEGGKDTEGVNAKDQDKVVEEIGKEAMEIGKDRKAWNRRVKGR